MSTEEREKLAQEIVAQINAQHGSLCPLGLTDLDVEGIRLLGRIARLGGGAAIVTGVGVLVTGVIGVFVLGFISWIKSKS